MGLPPPSSENQEGGSRAARLRILYLFAGAPRKSDFGETVRNLEKEYKVKGVPLEIEIKEVDILRGGEAHDLTGKELCKEIKEQMKRGECTTYLILFRCK